MPYDYARLNERTGWFTASAGTTYRVTDGQGATTTQDGRALIDGIPLAQTAGLPQVIRVCPH